jgi:hypothetical protein
MAAHAVQHKGATVEGNVKRLGDPENKQPEAKALG